MSKQELSVGQKFKWGQEPWLSKQSEFNEIQSCCCGGDNVQLFEDGYDLLVITECDGDGVSIVIASTTEPQDAMDAFWKEVKFCADADVWDSIKLAMKRAGGE